MDVPNILYIHELKHSLPQIFFAGETMPPARCRIATDTQGGMLGSLIRRLSTSDSYPKCRRARCVAQNVRS
jgi:hypothetical protein